MLLKMNDFLSPKSIPLIKRLYLCKYTVCGYPALPGSVRIPCSGPGEKYGQEPRLCLRRRGVKIGKNKISQEVNNLFSTTYHRCCWFDTAKISKLLLLQKPIGMSGNSAGLCVRKNRDEYKLRMKNYE
jgi:hypothetical protein